MVTSRSPSTWHCASRTRSNGSRVVGSGSDGSQRVALVDRENLDAEAVEKLGQGGEPVCQLRVFQSALKH